MNTWLQGFTNLQGWHYDILYVPLINTFWFCSAAIKAGVEMWRINDSFLQGIKTSLFSEGDLFSASTEEYFLSSSYSWTRCWTDFSWLWKMNVCNVVQFIDTTLTVSTVTRSVTLCGKMSKTLSWRIKRKIKSLRDLNEGAWRPRELSVILKNMRSLFVEENNEDFSLSIFSLLPFLRQCS